MTHFTDSDQQEIDAIQQSIANRMHRIDTGEWTHEQVMTTADKVSRIAWAVLMWVIAGIAAACFFFASVGMP